VREIVTRIIEITGSIASLKAAGLIVNASGRMSGYILSRPAETISIYDIHNNF